MTRSLRGARSQFQDSVEGASRMKARASTGSAISAASGIQIFRFERRLRLSLTLVEGVLLSAISFSAPTFP